MAKPEIRWLIRRDMPEILSIENASFDFAWNDSDFVEYLRRRNCIGMVAELDDRIVGYMIYELEKNVLNVVNFAVHPDNRRVGVGRQMVEKLVGKLSPQRRTAITLKVRETNLAAQKFFKSVGFICVGLLRGHYEETDEDAYLMRYKIGDSDKQMTMPKNRVSANA